MAEVEEFDLTGGNPLAEDYKEEEEKKELPLPRPKGGKKKKVQQKEEEGGDVDSLLDNIIREEHHVMKQKRPEKNIPRVMSKEELEEHRTVCSKLIRYAEHPYFNDVLKTMKFDLSHSTLAKKSLDDLKELHARVLNILNSLKTSEGMREMVIMGINFIETYCVRTPAINEKVKLKGLSAILAQDKGFQQDLAIFEIENCSEAFMSPSTRLCYSVVRASFAAHHANVLLEQAAKMQQQAQVQAPVQAQAQQAQPQGDIEKDKEKLKKELIEERKVELTDDLPLSDLDRPFVHELPKEEPPKSAPIIDPPKEESKEESPNNRSSNR